MIEDSSAMGARTSDTETKSSAIESRPIVWKPVIGFQSRIAQRAEIHRRWLYDLGLRAGDLEQAIRVAKADLEERLTAFHEELQRLAAEIGKGQAEMIDLLHGGE